jgi:hypothetical protein
MNINKVRLGAIAAMLALIIALSSACGPSPEPTPTPTPTPSGNQPPVISSLIPAQTQVLPSDIIEIRYEASDADGDAITYEWATIGGKFTGSGPVVSWIAPKDYGTYDIKVTVKDNKGGITQETTQLSVVQNQNPVISSLVADPTTVLPQGQSTISCIASDPDDDVVNYGWTASAGRITGVGDEVTWIAPDREGVFAITVTVDDGKGGQSLGKVNVVVSSVSTQETKTFNPIAEETGTVSGTGDKDTSRTRAGDDEKNVGYHAFWSFDLYSLRGTDVSEATLTFTTKKIVNDPFAHTISGLHGLTLVVVRTDPGHLPNFDVPKYKDATSTMWEPPTTIDVTAFVSNIGKGISTTDRLQFEAMFFDETNGNHVAEYIAWEKVTLTVTYIP